MNREIGIGPSPYPPPHTPPFPPHFSPSLPFIHTPPFPLHFPLLSPSPFPFHTVIWKNIHPPDASPISIVYSLVNFPITIVSLLLSQSICFPYHDIEKLCRRHHCIHSTALAPPQIICSSPKCGTTPPIYPQTPVLSHISPFLGYMSKMGVYGTIIGVKIQKIMTRAQARIMRVRAYTRVRRYLG